MAIYLVTNVKSKLKLNFVAISMYEMIEVGQIIVNKENRLN